MAIERSPNIAAVHKLFKVAVEWHPTQVVENHMRATPLVPIMPILTYSAIVTSRVVMVAISSDNILGPNYCYPTDWLIEV